MGDENQENELLKGPVILTVPACVTGSISHKPRKNVTSLKWSNRGRNDMSTFGFILTLLLLGTIGAVQTDNPMFWLLIGPAPFAVVLTGLVLFRQGFSPRGMGKTASSDPERHARISAQNCDAKK